MIFEIAMVVLVVYYFTKDPSHMKEWERVFIDDYADRGHRIVKLTFNPRDMALMMKLCKKKVKKKELLVRPPTREVQFIGFKKEKHPPFRAEMIRCKDKFAIIHAPGFHCAYVLKKGKRHKKIRGTMFYFNGKFCYHPPPPQYIKEERSLNRDSYPESDESDIEADLPVIPERGDYHGRYYPGDEYLPRSLPRANRSSTFQSLTRERRDRADYSQPELHHYEQITRNDLKYQPPPDHRPYKHRSQELEDGYNSKEHIRPYYELKNYPPKVVTNARTSYDPHQLYKKQESYFENGPVQTEPSYNVETKVPYEVRAGPAVQNKTNFNHPANGYEKNQLLNQAPQNASGYQPPFHYASDNIQHSSFGNKHWPTKPHYEIRNYPFPPDVNHVQTEDYRTMYQPTLYNLSHENEFQTRARNEYSAREIPPEAATNQHLQAESNQRTVDAKIHPDNGPPQSQHPIFQNKSAPETKADEPLENVAEICVCDVCGECNEERGGNKPLQHLRDKDGAGIRPLDSSLYYRTTSRGKPKSKQQMKSRSVKVNESQADDTRQSLQETNNQGPSKNREPKSPIKYPILGGRDQQPSSDSNEGLRIHYEEGSSPSEMEGKLKQKLPRSYFASYDGQKISIKKEYLTNTKQTDSRDHLHDVEKAKEVKPVFSGRRFPQHADIHQTSSEPDGNPQNYKHHEPALKANKEMNGKQQSTLGRRRTKLSKSLDLDYLSTDTDDNSDSDEEMRPISDRHRQLRRTKQKNSQEPTRDAEEGKSPSHENKEKLKPREDESELEGKSKKEVEEEDHEQRNTAFKRAQSKRSSRFTPSPPDRRRQESSTLKNKIKDKPTRKEPGLESESEEKDEEDEKQRHTTFKRTQSESSSRFTINPHDRRRQEPSTLKNEIKTKPAGEEPESESESVEEIEVEKPRHSTFKNTQSKSSSRFLPDGSTSIVRDYSSSADEDTVIKQIHSPEKSNVNVLQQNHSKKNGKNYKNRKLDEQTSAALHVKSDSENGDPHDAEKLSVRQSSRITRSPKSLFDDPTSTSQSHKLNGGKSRSTEHKFHRGNSNEKFDFLSTSPNDEKSSLHVGKPFKITTDEHPSLFDDPPSTLQVGDQFLEKDADRKSHTEHKSGKRNLNENLIVQIPLSPTSSEKENLGQHLRASKTDENPKKNIGELQPGRQIGEEKSRKNYRLGNPENQQFHPKEHQRESLESDYYSDEDGDKMSLSSQKQKSLSREKSLAKSISDEYERYDTPDEGGETPKLAKSDQEA